MLKAVGIEAFSFPGTIKSYVTDLRVGLRADVARQVDDLVFSVVTSCVDKGAARQDVQGLHPHLLLGGSTLNLQAKSNLYNGRPGAACLACFNPVEKDGEKIRALENRLRKMPTLERGEFLTSHGLDASSIEEYLSGAQCGGLGEAALRNYVVRPPRRILGGLCIVRRGPASRICVVEEHDFLNRFNAPWRYDDPEFFSMEVWATLGSELTTTANSTVGQSEPRKVVRRISFEPPKLSGTRWRHSLRRVDSDLCCDTPARV